MGKYVDKVCISWSSVHKDTSLLVQKIQKDNPNIKGLVALTRGGLVPSGIISRLMDIKLIDTLCIFSYTDKQDISSKQEKISLLKSSHNALDDLGLNWLLIDDLVDTGATARYAKSLMPHITIACLYAKPLGLDSTDYYIKKYNQDTWIQFPWETSKD